MVTRTIVTLVILILSGCRRLLSIDHSPETQPIGSFHIFLVVYEAVIVQGVESGRIYQLRLLWQLQRINKVLLSCFGDDRCFKLRHRRYVNVVVVGRSCIVPMLLIKERDGAFVLR